MPNPRYMDHQSEIEWSMRTTLIDWLLQVHARYHMLPETLWIAINIVDRFLSNRVVSLLKFQLVGVTAMFVAAKYEEIMAPSVDEFVYMTEGGYSREEILKGERIILQSLEFNISTYCSPYSWVRRISKADDYDIQTRTLSKFLMEVTLLDHRFLRAKPSMIAAIGMYLARRMLGGDWVSSRSPLPPPRITFLRKSQLTHTHHDAFSLRAGRTSRSSSTRTLPRRTCSCLPVSSSNRSPRPASRNASSTASTRPRVSREPSQ